MVFFSSTKKILRNTCKFVENWLLLIAFLHNETFHQHSLSMAVSSIFCLFCFCFFFSLVPEISTLNMYRNSMNSNNAYVFVSVNLLSSLLISCFWDFSSSLECCLLKNSSLSQFETLTEKVNALSSTLSFSCFFVQFLSLHMRIHFGTYQPFARV